MMGALDRTLLQNVKVLIVEDDADLRNSIRDVLQIFGAQTLEAANGNLGFEVLKSQDVDIILSDVRMPGGDGVAFLEKVREINLKHPPFIFLTGFSDLTADLAKSKGAQGMLSKPFDSLELARAIASQLKSQPAK